MEKTTAPKKNAKVAFIPAAPSPKADWHPGWGTVVSYCMPQDRDGFEEQLHLRGFIWQVEEVVGGRLKYSIPVKVNLLGGTVRAM
jgi:hypothetical protein